MLTTQQYDERRAALDAAIDAKRAEYEAAALDSVTASAPDPRAAQLRGELAALEGERDELDAAWRAATRHESKVTAIEQRRRRRAAYRQVKKVLDRAVERAELLDMTLTVAAQLIEDLGLADKQVRSAVASLAGSATARDAVQIARQLLSPNDLASALRVVEEQLDGRRTDVPPIGERVACQAANLKRYAQRALHVAEVDR